VAFPAAVGLSAAAAALQEDGDIAAACALSQASVALQDAEILQAAAALLATGVIPLTAGDLQAVESLLKQPGTYNQLGVLGPFSKQLSTFFLGHL
jgi:hypothetical protein